MNNYETLLQEAADHNVYVCESFDLNGDEIPEKRIDGYYIDGNIALDEHLESKTHKACVLAEELGHHYTTVGDILDQNNVMNRKQEQQARLWAYDKLIGLIGIVDAYKSGCRNRHEMAEHLGVEEQFLIDALERYHSKYGEYTTIDNYVISFEPLGVLELNL